MTSFVIAKRYALALLLAVLVVVPFVDASICSSEEQAHQDVAGAGDGHSDRITPCTCDHGHCHHSSTFVASNGFTSADTALNEDGHTFYEQPVTSHTPERLIRPPKA